MLLGFLIDSFMSLYYFNTSFTETNFSRIISETIKALEIKTMVFNLFFASNTILSWFFLLS